MRMLQVDNAASTLLVEMYVRLIGRSGMLQILNPGL